ncbi:MAG: hypothetical protein WCO55_06220 [Candidatus Falkowbacteria bacterium]
MGAIWSQQGSLKLSPTDGLIERELLVVGQEYPFQRNKHRLYMLDTPMELLTADWQAIARIIVTEITVGHNITKGSYKVLKIYSDEEVRVISDTIIPYQETRENK